MFISDLNINREMMLWNFTGISKLECMTELEFKIIQSYMIYFGNLFIKTHIEIPNLTAYSYCMPLAVMSMWVSTLQTLYEISRFSVLR